MTAKTCKGHSTGNAGRLLAVPVFTPDLPSSKLSLGGVLKPMATPPGRFGTKRVVMDELPALSLKIPCRMLGVAFGRSGR